MDLAHNDLPHVVYDSLIDSEFSEIGRNPHFAPGWFIVPAAMLTGFVAITLLGYLL